MNLQQLYRSTTWEEVEKKFWELYREDTEQSLEGFQEVYEFVCQCNPVNNTDQITVGIELIEETQEDGTVESWYDVYGVKPGEDVTYSLEFCLFSEWAGFDVDEDLIEEFSLAEIVAHTLWEMTYHGFSEETIKAEQEELDRRYLEAMKMLLEEEV